MVSKPGGFALLYRSIFDNPAFKDASEAMFFGFLVMKANFKPGQRRYKDKVYDLKRGELVCGERQLAEEYGFSHKRVRTLMKRLEDGKMVGRKQAQHGAHHAPVITICNYALYQDFPENGAHTEAQEGHRWGTPNKQGNKVSKKQEGENAPSSAAETEGKGTQKFAFKGSVIRLTEKDFNQWEKTYHAIPDLKAELSSLDRWFASEDPKNGERWFIRTSNSMNRKHQEWAAKGAEIVNGPLERFTPEVEAERAQRQRERLEK